MLAGLSQSVQLDLQLVDPELRSRARVGVRQRGPPRLVPLALQLRRLRSSLEIQVRERILQRSKGGLQGLSAPAAKRLPCLRRLEVDPAPPRSQGDEVLLGRARPLRRHHAQL